METTGSDRAAEALIRPARADDDAALAALDAATWSPDVTPGSVPEPGQAFFRDASRVDDILVAELDGQVVGYVALHQAIPLPSHGHVLEINGLAVDPERQGLGTGRALVEAAKHRARTQGARKLSLRVLRPNAAARRLYESCGFSIEGVLRAEFVLDGRAVDDILMACRLDTPGG